MSFKTYFLAAILFIEFLTKAQALECSGRVPYFKGPFSNKCIVCQKLNIRNPGQLNCKFPNTDHCCETSSCNAMHPNFSKWTDGNCEVP